MATYPTAVKTFVTRNAGDTIQPAHINDVQDEITAIETGLLNGTAPLHSSNSTLANLHVPGGSTLASLTVLAPAASVCVSSTVLQEIAGSFTNTAVTFETERWMTVAGMHSTASNPSRLIPDSSGLYAVTGCVRWGGGSTAVGICQAAIRVDGSSLIGVVSQADAGALTQNVRVDYYFRSTTQYVELVVAQNSGSTKSMALAGDAAPTFMLTRYR